MDNYTAHRRQGSTESLLIQAFKTSTMVGKSYQNATALSASAKHEELGDEITFNTVAVGGAAYDNFRLGATAGTYNVEPGTYIVTIKGVDSAAEKFELPRERGQILLEIEE